MASRPSTSESTKRLGKLTINKPKSPSKTKRPVTADVAQQSNPTDAKREELWDSKYNPYFTDSESRYPTAASSGEPYAPETNDLLGVNVSGMVNSLDGSLPGISHSSAERVEYTTEESLSSHQAVAEFLPTVSPLEASMNSKTTFEVPHLMARALQRSADKLAAEQAQELSQVTNTYEKLVADMNAAHNQKIEDLMADMTAAKNKEVVELKRQANITLKESLSQRTAELQNEKDIAIQQVRKQEAHVRRDALKTQKKDLNAVHEVEIVRQAKIAEAKLQMAIVQTTLSVEAESLIRQAAEMASFQEDMQATFDSEMKKLKKACDAEHQVQKEAFAQDITQKLVAELQFKEEQVRTEAVEKYTLDTALHFTSQHAKQMQDERNANRVEKLEARRQHHKLEKQVEVTKKMLGLATQSRDASELELKQKAKLHKDELAKVNSELGAKQVLISEGLGREKDFQATIGSQARDIADTQAKMEKQQKDAGKAIADLQHQLETLQKEIVTGTTREEQLKKDILSQERLLKELNDKGEMVKALKDELEEFKLGGGAEASRNAPGSPSN
jgi:hypothetical protein